MNTPDPVLIIVLAIAVLFMAGVGVIAAATKMTGTIRPKEKKDDGKLHDIEFQGAVIHPVRKTDKQLEVRWKVNADG